MSTDKTREATWRRACRDSGYRLSKLRRPDNAGHRYHVVDSTGRVLDTAIDLNDLESKLNARVEAYDTKFDHLQRLARSLGYDLVESTLDPRVAFMIAPDPEEDKGHLILAANLDSVEDALTELAAKEIGKRPPQGRA